MKRSVGLTLVGILVILLSALFFLIGAFGIVVMTLAPASSMPPPTIAGHPDPRVTAIIGMAFILAISAFGIVNGIGLVRRWVWSRYVSLIFGFVVAGLSLLCGIAMMVVPFPPSPGLDNQFIGKFRIAMFVFYLFWTVLFLGMSLFLLRKQVAEEFGSSKPETAELRPLAVWTVAGLQLVGLISIPMFLFGHMPVFFMGVTIQGLFGKVFMLLWMLVYAGTGLALFRRMRFAYWVAFGLYLLGLVNGAVILLPGPSARFLELMKQYNNYAMVYDSGMIRFIMLIGVCSAVVPLILLIVGRNKYFQWCAQGPTPVPLPQA